jgi:hypothetical protein
MELSTQRFGDCLHQLHLHPDNADTDSPRNIGLCVFTWLIAPQYLVTCYGHVRFRYGVLYIVDVLSPCMRGGN